MPSKAKFTRDSPFKDKNAYFLIFKQVNMSWNEFLYSDQICGLKFKFQRSSLRRKENAHFLTSPHW